MYMYMYMYMYISGITYYTTEFIMYNTSVYNICISYTVYVYIYICLFMCV